MNVVVLEPRWGGHRLAYVRHVVDFASERAMSVVLATGTGALESREFAEHLRDAPSFEVMLLGELPSEGRAYNRWLIERLATILAGSPRDIVVLPEGDKALPRLVLRPFRDRARLRVLVMRSPRYPADLVRVRQVVKSISASLCRLTGVTVLNLSPAAVVSTDDVPRRDRRRRVPDPVTVHDGAYFEAARLRGELPGGRFYFGVFGHISRRKNVGLVVRALERAGAERTGLILVGSVAPDVEAELNSALAAYAEAGGHVYTRFGVVTDAELDGAISAADAAVLAHSSEGPSGILGKAVAVGTPVIAAGARSLSDDVVRLSCGTWSRLDETALAAQFSAALAWPKAPRSSHPMEGPEEFASALLGLAR